MHDYFRVFQPHWCIFHFSVNHFSGSWPVFSSMVLTIFGISYLKKKKIRSLSRSSEIQPLQKGEATTKLWREFKLEIDSWSPYYHHFVFIFLVTVRLSPSSCDQCHSLHTWHTSCVLFLNKWQCHMLNASKQISYYWFQFPPLPHK